MTAIGSVLGIAVRLGKPNQRGALRGGVSTPRGLARVTQPRTGYLGNQPDRHGCFYPAKVPPEFPEKTKGLAYSANPLIYGAQGQN